MPNSVTERIKIRNIYKIVEESKVVTCSITLNTAIVISDKTLKSLRGVNLEMRDLVGEIVYRSLAGMRPYDGSPTEIRPRIMTFIGATEEVMKKINGKHELWNTVQNYIDEETSGRVVTEICTTSKTHLIALVLETPKELKNEK